MNEHTPELLRPGTSRQPPGPAPADIAYRVCPPIANEELNALFAAAWPNHRPRDFRAVLARGLTYVCAYAGPRLVGFVNVATDGGLHAFILDTTVHPDFQRRGIGRQLVRQAADIAREHGLEWLHVDYEPPLESFYRACGFNPCPAGLLRLQPPQP